MKLLLLPLWLALFFQIPSAKSPSSTETLRFNWPKDLTARVETEKTRERRSTSTTTTSMKASYRMRVSPHPEGLVVRYDEFRIDGAPPAEMGAASEALMAMIPSLIVDAEGGFKRVEDIAALKAAVAAMFEPIQKQSGGLPKGLEDFMGQFLTEEVLSAVAGQEWQTLVGAWHELPLTSEKFSLDMEEPSPILRDVKVPMKVTGGMVERRTCERGGAKIDCAVFEMRSAVDQAAMEALMKRMMSGIKDVPAVKYDRIDVVTVVRVRLETHTMVPHELTTTKTIEMAASAPGEGRMEMKQIDRRTSRFSYLP